MADETIRLILETKGAETIERLEKSTEEYRTLLAMLTAEFSRGEIEADKFLKTQSAWGAELNKETALLERLKAALAAQTAAAAAAERQTYELADAYDLVEQEMTQVVAMAPQLQRSFDWTTIVSPKVRQLAEDFDFATLQMGQGLNRVGTVAGKDGRFGQGILSASFAIQDFTSAGANLERGLYAIQNNIPMILTGLGVGAGLAGAVSIVTVGVGLLVTNWSSIETLWKGSVAQDQAKKMEELAEATKLAADETARLKKFQGAGLDEQKGTVDTAVKEVGYGQATADIKAALIRRGGSFGEEADKALAEGLLRNATQGHKGALAMLDEMFSGSGAGAASQFGQALADPGGKKAMAEAKAAGQRKVQEDRRLEEQRAKEQADAERLAADQAAGLDEDNKKAFDTSKKIDDAKKQIADESNRKQIEQQIKREEESVKAGGYDKLAEASLAETQAQGGAFDRNGQFHRMTPEQIQRYVSSQVERELRSRNRGMDPETASNISTKVTQDAQSSVNKDVVTAMSQGLTQQQATQQVAADLQAVVAAMINRMQGIEMGNRQLQARQRQIDQFVRRPGGPANLPGGR